MIEELNGLQVHITGIVQGVGFRPFVYGLATRLALKGWVRNTSAGVDIQVDGTPAALESFITELRSNPPPLARIDVFQTSPFPADGFTDFQIIDSTSITDAFIPVSPDVSICDDCLRELFDPADRRYRYPFINCTNCGPRFTIVKDIPYDRPQTTMAEFSLCPDCFAEYHNPLDRRFHAQPVACPECGPQVWLESSTNREAINNGDSAIRAAVDLFAQGKIIAVKGLGGFHLACDAANSTAVDELRRRKLRVDKPFALMMRDVVSVQEHCLPTPEEIELLLSRQRPVVIIKRKPDSPISPHVAPNQSTIGVMLPYTPLHYLLLAGSGTGSKPVYVMTSGNLSEEPIATDNEEARQRLSSLADYFLMHDRPIHIRCDDSVVRAIPASIHWPEQRFLYPVRRSRGYAPDPVQLPWDCSPILAVGSELKNVFCLTRDRYAFLSHHIGDMENYETLTAFESGIRHFERLFRITPRAFAYDLHPDYMSTRFVQERAEQEKLPVVGVQHHHAHIAACMAENQIPDGEPVIGIALDGTGFGVDGAIWGGEFMVATYHNFVRESHLVYIPLPGGSLAVKEPWRTALSWLSSSGLDWDDDLPPVSYALEKDKAQPNLLSALQHQIQHRLNAPLTSSMGRLFDAAASLIGIRQIVNYEAQAAIELEGSADPAEMSAYHPDSKPLSNYCLFHPGYILRGIVADIRSGVGIPIISARFHNSIAQAIGNICSQVRIQTGIQRVCLSGGVWQNMVLLSKTTRLLEQNHFEIFTHHQVPTNDGGIALGQAAIANFTLRR